MNYPINTNQSVFDPPKILLRHDNFLTQEQILFYQSLLHTSNWTPSPNLQNIQYFSLDLYRQYQWNGDWSNVGWNDNVSPEWENLYKQIANHLPDHYVHWVDAKITPPLCTGTPRHRDKDPWTKGGSENFDKAITILLNLNHQWNDSWGGEFVLWSAKESGTKSIEFEEFQRVPINPGQLLILENCWHSINPVTNPDCSRISFVMHVLKYKKHDSI